MPNEPHDDHEYLGVPLYGQSVKFFVDALKFYAERLKQDLRKVHEDADLALFISPDAAVSPLRREIERTERALKWLDEKWDQDENGFGVQLHVSHGVIRYLKSAGSSYLIFLQDRRDALAQRINVEAVLSEVDRRLAKSAELLKAGVFGNASIVPLLVVQAQADAAAIGSANSIGAPNTNVSQPRPVIVGRIDILDNALNARCLDLFEIFHQSSNGDRFDTVVMEATKILEDRIRQTANLDSSHDGLKLVAAAFGGSAPLLRLSSHSAEQDAAHALFRGVFGFVRNPFHHRLVGTIAPQRVIQILGTIDYLLYLLDTTRIQAAPVATDNQAQAQ